MFKGNLKRHFLVFLLCLAVGLRAHAQTTTQGSIAGTVFDATGAVVPGATVTIHNNGTNAEIMLTADDSGYYKAPLLEPGTYTVTVHAANFSDYRANAVVVQVSQTTTVAPKLGAGSEGTMVEVSTSAPVLNFESPDFTANLNQVALQNIPINNRRWSALAMTTPGVVADSSGFGLVSIRGISTLLNNVLVDGADDNDSYFSEERGRTREAYSTSENAIREFQVNTGVYSAEFGRAAGGVINSVTKSGTNSFHGQLYFYDRQSSWGAYQQQTTQTIPVFTPGNPVPTSFNSGVHIKPKDLRKIYGGTVGGPIYRDKIFFTYTYDQHTRLFPAVSLPGSPASFYTLPDAAAPLGSSCNTTTGLMTGGTATDQQACTLAAREGLLTYAAGAAAYINGIVALLPDINGTTPRAGYQEINTPKLDWQLSSKEHLSFLYHRLRWDSPGGVQTSPVVAYAVDTQGNDFVKVDYLVGKLTSLITPNISNEILYQYGRELLPETQQPFSAYTLANLVGTNGNIPFLQNLDTSSNGINIGSPYYSYRKALPDERKWQVADTLYWNKGNHSFKIGGDILHNYDLINALNGAIGSTSSAQNGTYVYNSIGNYLADLHSKGAAGTCNSTQVAAASAGTPVATGTYQCYATFQQTFGNPGFDIATVDWSVFIQDNWKFSPRLTLELGARYDYQHIPNPIANLVNPAVPQTTNHPSDKNNIGPRVGFAYDVYGSGKTVLRGGYGMYYGRILNGVILNTLLNTGLAAGQYTTAFSPVATSGPTSTPPILPNAMANTGTPVTPNVYFLSKTLQNPMVHEFDLAVQQDLGRGTVFSISYLGSMGRELPNYINTNLNPATRQDSLITVVDPTGKGPIAAGLKHVSQYTSFINPTYQAITGLYSNINSSYNAFSVELQNRTLKSVQFDLNYTWSHALDYLQNVNTGVANENWLDPNTTNPRENYGNSVFNVPNRFVGYVLYTEPNVVRKGSLLGYLANGWSIDNSFQMQSGLPYSAVLSSNAAKLTSNAIGFGWYGATSGAANIPLAGIGNHQAPRDIVDDGRVQKGFNFTDRYNLQIFVNVFNIANHQNVSLLTNAAYVIGSATATSNTITYNGSGSNPFGNVTRTNNSGFLYAPRLIEIGGKFNF